ncbi:class I SAM-dependent DNA methyltransferase [Fodinibius saliphilus]|uniref:class I SAM-dependent DNA methyltransferase n=1 Tax=Fodinibius saliphilus TaxID=1920650 RepID=UPI001108467D|nr:class I SAM-dependent methyltransferase [Fodinibius saliphilus]
MSTIEYPEYSKLADIYDSVMQDVNYDLWADFIDALMLNHHPNPETVLELACGTGSLALSLDELECYDILGTDKSPHMITKAREKNKEMRCNVDFEVMDFLDINLDQTFDIVVSVFDSINYLHSPEEIKQFLKEVKVVLDSQSLLIFDFTTPKNSMRAIDYLHNEEGYTDDGYHFFRKSTYDSGDQIHVNDFKIRKLAEDRETVLAEYQESHSQRAYTLEQMLDIIDETAYNLIAKYSDFEFEEADEHSLRITMVLQCPNIQ